MTGTNKSGGIRIAACDWSIGIMDTSALDLGKRIGIQGIEVDAGPAEDRLRITDAALQARYLEAMKNTGLSVTSVCIGMLNDNPIHMEARASGWIRSAIAAAARLGAGIVLMPFFGKAELKDAQGLKGGVIDSVVGILSGLAAEAGRVGVALGVENTLNANENIQLLEKIGRDNVRIYYDVGNAAWLGLDSAAEIRLLGDRMCQIHFKDGGYLGEGGVNVAAASSALHDIGYKGWLVLETTCPSGNAESDFKRNADYLRATYLTSRR